MVSQLSYVNCNVKMLHLLCTRVLLSETLPHRHKIVIAGNHEISLDDRLPFLNQSHTVSPSDGVQHPRELLTNCCYLQDAFVMVAGYKIYGAPW